MDPDCGGKTQWLQHLETSSLDVVVELVQEVMQTNLGSLLKSHPQLDIKTSRHCILHFESTLYSNFRGIGVVLNVSNLQNVNISFHI